MVLRLPLALLPRPLVTIPVLLIVRLTSILSPIVTLFSVHIHLACHLRLLLLFAFTRLFSACVAAEPHVRVACPNAIWLTRLVWERHRVIPESRVGGFLSWLRSLNTPTRPPCRFIVLVIYMFWMYPESFNVTIHRPSPLGLETHTTTHTATICTVAPLGWFQRDDTHRHDIAYGAPASMSATFEFTVSLRLCAKSGHLNWRRCDNDDDGRALPRRHAWRERCRLFRRFYDEYEAAMSLLTEICYAIILRLFYYIYFTRDALICVCVCLQTPMEFTDYFVCGAVTENGPYFWDAVDVQFIIFFCCFISLLIHYYFIFPWCFRLSNH